MTDITFASLGVAEPLLRALEAENYSRPTPIQTRAIPLLLEGRDLLGIAQTGTGKTAAFGLPLLQRLAAEPGKAGPKGTRALILAPTRELAIQIGDALKTYGRHLGLRQAVLLGGVGQGPQVKALAGGVDILIATPGRLLDLLGQRHLRLDRVSTLVLDEADRMLDMGFVRDVRKIVAALPAARQTLLFSATMPNEVARLAGEILDRPERVEVTPEVITVERIDQFVAHVPGGEKQQFLARLLQDPAVTRAIVFSRTKHGANRIAGKLERAGIEAAAIHGNKSQGARQRALEDFRAGSVQVLVATDIAARGIDVEAVSHVINFDLPNEPESYVHRIGRTARAGAGGIAISFCDTAERPYLAAIEKLTRQRLRTFDGATRSDESAATAPVPASRGNHERQRAAEQPRRRRRRGGSGTGSPRAA